MKKIWIIQYNDGTADVYDTEQSGPAYPYVDAFQYDELKKENAALRAEVDALRKLCGEALLAIRFATPCMNHYNELCDRLAMAAKGE